MRRTTLTGYSRRATYTAQEDGVLMQSKHGLWVMGVASTVA